MRVQEKGFIERLQGDPFLLPTAYSRCEGVADLLQGLEEGPVHLLAI